MARTTSDRAHRAPIGAWALASLLAAAACAGPAAPAAGPAPIEARAERVLDPEGAAREARLLALLADLADRADEPMATGEAELLVEGLGLAADRARTIPDSTLLVLVRHPYEQVRAAALRATETLHRRGRVDTDVALRIYWLAALDPQFDSLRRAALGPLGEYALDDRLTYMHVRRVAREPVGMHAHAAFVALRRGGVDPGPFVVEALEREPRSTGLHRLLVHSLARSSAPGAHEQLEWIATDSPDLHASQLAQAFLDVERAGLQPIGTPTTHRPLEGDPGWRPVPEAVLRERLGSTRLAFFGEMHDEGGPLREAQRRAVDQFAEGGGELVLGFEPSVERVQRPVIDHAVALGFEAISTEPGVDLDAVGLIFHGRDSMVARTVDGRLRSSPDTRVFVLRGESHLKPGGHLDASLEEDAVVIHCGLDGLPLLVDDPRIDLMGAVYASDVVDGLFMVICYPYGSTSPSPALRGRLERPDGAGDR